jgi:outer membrane lipoprotein-sorting protein
MGGKGERVMLVKKLAVVLALVLALGGSGLAFAAFAAPPSPEQILANAANTLNSAQDGHAILGIDVNSPDKKGTATVEVWAKKIANANPATYMLRAQVTEASDSKEQGATLVSDGKQFWVHVPSQNAVWTGTVALWQQDKGHLAAQSPQALVQQLLDVSNVTLTGTESVSGHSAYKLQFVPKSGKSPQALAGATGSLWIDQNRWLPLQGSMGQGQVTVKSVELNISVPDSRFQFQPPAGAKVVNADSLRPQHLSLSDAQKSAGFKLLQPTFVPDGETLVDVLKSGNAIILRYESSSGAFAIAQGIDSANKPSGVTGKSVSVRGTTGTLYTNADGSRVLLVWTENGRTNSVSGTLSSQDALRIAESLQ